MRIERTLKKVGGSVMIPIPAEFLQELRWGRGSRCRLSLRTGLSGWSLPPSVRRTT
jgi:hypothetical protein